MDVVKFTDSRDSREGHLEKCEAGRRVDLLWSKTIRGGVHLLAPRPETIGRVLRTMLRAPPNDALKRVRVRVDHARQQRAAFETDCAGRLGSFDYLHDLATVAHKCPSRLKLSVRVDKIR